MTTIMAFSSACSMTEPPRWERTSRRQPTAPGSRSEPDSAAAGCASTGGRELARGLRDDAERRAREPGNAGISRISPSKSGGTRPILVLIVEDHPILAEGLVSLLSEVPDFEVLGSVETVRDAIAVA